MDYELLKLLNGVVGGVGSNSSDSLYSFHAEGKLKRTLKREFKSTFTNFNSFESFLIDASCSVVYDIISFIVLLLLSDIPIRIQGERKAQGLTPVAQIEILRCKSTLV